MTSPGRKTNYAVIEGKKRWLKRELPEIKEKHFETEKARLAKTKHVLIDDKKSNIDEWIEEGGIGILHTNTKDTIEQLKELRALK